MRSVQMNIRYQCSRISVALDTPKKLADRIREDLDRSSHCSGRRSVSDDAL